jgi:tRNA(fMet)-specific endonuclease VapC
MQQAPFYMLDTNIVSAAIRGDARIDARLLQLDQQAWCISAITHSELCFGLALRPEASRLAPMVERFLMLATTAAWDAQAAQCHGRLRAQLRLAGTPIGDFDEMIAGHALSLQAILITDNERHFKRIFGLSVENWLR